MKKIKGFTLIECLIALAILGIASLVMAQIYANVSRINKENAYTNKSLAYQIKYAEKYVDDGTKGDTTNTIELTYTGTAGDGNGGKDANNNPIPVDTPSKLGKSNSTSTPYMKVTRKDPSDSTKQWTYSFAVDLYVLYGRADDGAGGSNVSTDIDKDGNTADENTYLNYKYFLPHTVVS